METKMSRREMVKSVSKISVGAGIAIFPFCSSLAHKKNQTDEQATSEEKKRVDFFGFVRSFDPVTRILEFKAVGVAHFDSFDAFFEKNPQLKHEKTEGGVILSCRLGEKPEVWRRKVFDLDKIPDGTWVWINGPVQEEFHVAVRTCIYAQEHQPKMGYSGIRTTIGRLKREDGKIQVIYSDNPIKKQLVHYYNKSIFSIQGTEQELAETKFTTWVQIRMDNDGSFTFDSFGIGCSEEDEQKQIELNTKSQDIESQKGWR